jgi:hypothetical protein
MCELITYLSGCISQLFIMFICVSSRAQNGVAPCLNTCEFIKNMKETQAGTYSVWFGSDVTVITGSLQ